MDDWPKFTTEHALYFINKYEHAPNNNQLIF